MTTRDDATRQMMNTIEAAVLDALDRILVYDSSSQAGRMILHTCLVELTGRSGIALLIDFPETRPRCLQLAQQHVEELEWHSATAGQRPQ